MVSQKHKKALVFFSAGVGDSILLVPLVNELKKNNYQVTGLFTSQFGCDSIFENTTLLNSVIVKTDKTSLILFATLNVKKYDLVFLNHFSYSRLNILAAGMLGKSVITNHPHKKSKLVKYIEPISDVHDALQNVFMYKPDFELQKLNFDLQYCTTTKTSNKLSLPYAVLQISSANNNAPYKNWEFKNWLHTINYLNKHYPNLHLVLLGDNTEAHLNDKLNTSNSITTSLIGKTTLNEVMEIIANSKLYIGLDSGLMHMAVAHNKPTFTIWGASNSVLYGYEWMGKRHKIVSQNLACAPCAAWINPNTSRVSNPLMCPDFKCIRDITTTQVTDSLKEFIESIM